MAEPDGAGHRSGESEVPVTELNAATTAWLAERAIPGERVTAMRTLAGGFSNDNLLLTTARGRRFVLRRFRRADTCAIEAALAERLRGVVAVPEVLAADPAGAAAGEPLLLSAFMPGELLSTALDGAAAAGTDGELGRLVGGALAAIGTVRFARPGMFTGPDLVPDPSGMPTDLAGFVADCLQRSPAPLSAAERAALRRVASREQAVLDRHAGAAALVHSDFNGKNILVRRRADRWELGAVLDWEFAYSGHPMADVGNMLRFAARLPADYVSGFLAGLRDAGADLPPDWGELARALDLFALADLLTRPREHPLFDAVLGAVRERLA